MPSLTTVFRAIVMVATGVIVVKGWQLYGPSDEQVKTFVAAALEKAHAAWSSSSENATSSPAVVDPRTAPTVVAEIPTAVSPPLGPAPQLVPAPNEGVDIVRTEQDAALPTSPPGIETSGEQVVTKLLAQLQQLGAADAQVVKWGSSGQLFRCSCKAKLVETSPLARHFEAVAGAPNEAVEQVVAKVEAWRTEQQSLLR